MLPAWLKFTILIVILALVLTVIYGLTLKHQVNIRTLELRKSNQEMEQRIIERTAELEKVKAKEADMLKSAFLATMSHELRTPLNSIIGFTGILLQELPGHINEEQRKQLTIVQNSAHHLLDLINDILDISKIESGQLDLHYESFFLNDSIDKVVKIVMPQAEKNGLELKVEISQSELEVYCDKRRLEQVILNLISNAIKFTETGYVAIIVHSEEDKYQIQVQDTGIGIAPEDLEQLFLPFHQNDTGLTRQYEGTGLGLNICLKLINMMGGTITVDSIPGKGSIFTVIMPYKKEFTG
jgi:signal transduction histidine kinase